MQVSIRKMGNSHGVLIPKAILVETGFTDVAELILNKGVIEIRPIKNHPRVGWTQDAQGIAAQTDDALVWPALANEGDEVLQW